MGRVFKFQPDVRIGESADHVFAVEKSAEDLSLIARPGLKAGPAVDHSSEIRFGHAGGADHAAIRDPWSARQYEDLILETSKRDISAIQSD
jgi:hypothetical protein